MNSTLITIFARGTTSPRIDIPIGIGSNARYMLMKEDYIRLRFSSARRIKLLYGDYVNVTQRNLGSKLAGILAQRYVLCDANNPRYNENTRGYDYDVRLDAWYYSARRYKFMLPYRQGDEYVRKEANWSLTDKLEKHVRVWLLSAFAAGFRAYDSTPISAEIVPGNGKYMRIQLNENDAGYDYVINEYPGGDKAVFDNDTKVMTYSHVNLIDALNMMAQAWECEWWFSGSKLIFGRMQNASNPVKLEDGIDAAITASGSAGNVATRLYAFGSTRNIPYSYRKKLEFTVGKNNNGDSHEITDDNRQMLPSMFRQECHRTVTESETIRWTLPLDAVAYRAHVNDLRISVDMTSGTVNYENKYIKPGEPTYSGTFTLNEHARKEGIVLPSTSADYYLYFPQGVRLMVLAPDSKTDLYVGVNIEGMRNGQHETIRQKDVRIYTPTAINSKRDGQYRLYEFESLDLNIDGLSSVMIEQGKYTQLGIHIEARDGIKILAFTVPSITVNLVFGSQIIETSVSFDGGATWKGALLNEANASQSSAEASRLTMPDSEAAVGDKYIIQSSNLVRSGVPGAYYSEEDSSAAINTIGEIRLRMSKCDYVDAKDDDGNVIATNENDIIEDVQVFDDIFPQRVDTISEIREVSYSETKTDEVTAQTYGEKWNAYMFKAAMASRDFSSAYEIKTGDGLFVTFQGSSLLAGMTFSVVYNPTHPGEAAKPELLPNGYRNEEAAWFEIIKNEDYGTRLPNDVLRPREGDEFVLWGYDASYIETMIPEAEEALKVRAMAYMEKALHSDRTYTVALLPEKAMNTWLNKGDNVTIDTQNYFIPRRTERVLGFDVCLDIPEDKPKFFVGEHAVYSRIKSIEDKIKNN